MRPAYGKLLNYLINDRDRLYDETGKGLLIVKNFKGNGITEWIGDLQENEELRKHPRKGHVFMTQEILSFRKESAAHITTEKLSDIATEYMRRRNPNSMHICVAHFDKKHYHIHALISGLEYGTGKSMRMTHEQLAELKQGIQSYVLTKYPELRNSAVRHGRKSEARTHDKEYQTKSRTGKPTKREEIGNIVSECRKASTTRVEFLDELKQRGIETYVRGGEVYGVVFQGMKYRFKSLGAHVERSISVGVERDQQKRKSLLKKLRTKQIQEDLSRNVMS